MTIDSVNAMCKDGVSIYRINGNYVASSNNRRIHENWNLVDMSHWLYINGYMK